ncbi:hypothetical protein QOZ80_5BG0449940 [Eleusine coracana subsp. coracana]|nr:hypothetical protein QOZ80_5BG0449940 [Eleusine coracana subsp. coracana]
MAVSWSDSATSSVDLASEQRHSPIPYRVGPLDYFPPINCKCGQKATMWISWSDDNPDRRYVKCYRARSGGCDMYEWFEGPVDPFVATLLVDLRNEVWKLRRQKRELFASMQSEVHEKELAMADLKSSLVAVRKMAADLKREVAELRAGRKKTSWMCRMMVGSCCVLLVSGVVANVMF